MTTDDIEKTKPETEKTKTETEETKPETEKPQEGIKVEDIKAEENEKPQKTDEEKPEEDSKTKEETPLDEKKLENVGCMLFPTYASEVVGANGEKEWKMTIGGWTYAMSPSSRLDNWLLAAGRTYGGLSENTADYKHFSSLLDQFLCETLNMINLQLCLPGVIFEKIVQQNSRDIQGSSRNAFQELVNSGSSGHFEKEIVLDANTYKLEEGHSKVLKVEAVFEGEEKSFSGIVDLVGPQGISIISDIDDTIKITNILDGKEAIIENTFFKTAIEEPNMPSVYSQFASQGIHFHYVSNSPWQVWPALNGFFDRVGFPQGSAHLRNVSIHELVMSKAGQHKLDVIPKIFKDFPERKFILIGDTGELDPEVYQQVYNQFPDQVLKVFIHDVTTPHAVKVEQEAKEKPKSYYEMLTGFISHEAAFLTKGTSSPLAVGAMTQTEVPDGQQNISNPDVPLVTKLDQLKERIERVSAGMRPGVFTVFSDPTTLLSDPVIVEALGNTKH